MGNIYFLISRGRIIEQECLYDDELSVYYCANTCNTSPCGEDEICTPVATSCSLSPSQCTTRVICGSESCDSECTSEFQVRCTTRDAYCTCRPCFRTNNVQHSGIWSTGAQYSPPPTGPTCFKIFPSVRVEDALNNPACARNCGYSLSGSNDLFFRAIFGL